VDRVAIGQAPPFITEDLGLTTIQMGWALAIFGYAYALFEIPGGWMAARSCSWRPRRART
jgi:MFS family permease